MTVSDERLPVGKRVKSLVAASTERTCPQRDSAYFFGGDDGALEGAGIVAAGQAGHHFEIHAELFSTVAQLLQIRGLERSERGLDTAAAQLGHVFQEFDG